MNFLSSLQNAKKGSFYANACMMGAETGNTLLVSLVNRMRHAKAPSQAPLDHPAVQRLVTVARSHFFAHGIRSVTMDDLADELGMSKKTLYAWFPSKSA